MRFHIEDMTCSGCAGNVVKAIHSIDPDAKVVTDPRTRRVQVTSSATSVQLEAALCQADYPPQGSDAPVAKSVASAPPQGMTPSVSMQVEGMDCASCVAKIETALARMPGISDIRLNFATERLELALAPDSATQAGDIEKTIKRLGFGVSAAIDHKRASGVNADKHSAAQGPRWWQTRKGKQVAGLGVLMGVASGRARAGIRALASLVPKTAVLLDSEGKQREVCAASLRVNDHVLVRPGDRVSADGVIIEGMSSLDESPVTGESIPRAKTTGDNVFAGSINVDGVLRVRVDKAAADNTISRIIQLVEQAQASKAPTARFIEQFSRYYTPAVMAIAALIVLVPPLAMGADWGTWVYRGLALLLIACPCALVLSTPAAIASGLAVGTRRGLLIKGDNALETIGRVTTIAFDKTGTLTEGKPRVTDVIAFTQEPEDAILAMAASVESGSNHPLAKAIVNHANAANILIPAASGAFATAGKAVHATVAGRSLAIGSPVYAGQAAALSPTQHAHIEVMQNDGKTVSVLFDEQTREALGLVALRDEPRQDAQEGVALLKAMGVRSVMLTGDNRLTAQAIAGHLGMDWEAELLPQDKLSLINTMKHNAKVAMVGDGINDAPALATADAGIAMGGGTDVAIETADAALLKSRVTDVAHLVALSRATMANIHQNVIFALGLKGIFLITTVLGITGLWIAVLADTGATAIVTLNALRLLSFKGSNGNVSLSHHTGNRVQPRIYDPVQ